MTSPKPDQLDVVIVGAGLAGLYMLLKARRAGLVARVLEAAGGIGGTWYHNRYPGARVDVESLEYSFGFCEVLQQEWQWTERYASQPELLRYVNHVADRFGLRDGIELNTRVVRAVWNEDGEHWQVDAEDGRRWSARFVVMASGPLSTPNMPAFEGLETFEGAVYHTARWPHEPVDFTGKRVAVVGTGSSGVQSIPVIAQQAAELFVFQRTATYSVPAHNAPLDPAYEERIKADYAGFRARNRKLLIGFGASHPPGTVSALAVDDEEREAVFEKRWQIGGLGMLSAFSDIMFDERANALLAEFVRRKIRSKVRDPEVARLLTPAQTIGCKRLCVDTGYYETFNRDNVRLIDVGTQSIEAITPRGLRAGGREYEFDALVLATGFDAMTGTMTRLDLRGRDGLRIQDKWRAGPANYLGLMVAGFPNLFNIGGPGSPAVFTNVVVAIEQQVDWIADCIAGLTSKRLATIEATAEAEAAWIAFVNKVANKTLFVTCNSWYLGANIDGKPRVFMPLFGFPAYAGKCEQVARDGYPGFMLAESSRAGA